MNDDFRRACEIAKQKSIDDPGTRYVVWECYCDRYGGYVSPKIDTFDEYMNRASLMDEPLVQYEYGEEV